MLTLEKFSGINNVLPTERLGPTELRTALNVDIGLSGELIRRDGYTVTTASCHKNLYQADGYMLATANSDLIRVGGAVLYPSIGVDRMWYMGLPDGRTAFSNGLINGITDGTSVTGWGVPVPASLGALMDIAGDLFPGDYQYQLSYVRLSDGLEGGVAYSNPLPVALGGIFLSGLPTLSGHKINVYLTSHNSDNGYYAGSTTSGVFSFTGKNDTLVMPCRTDFMSPAPVGTVSAFWRGRSLIAAEDTLWASRPHQYELFDLRRDFKRFADDITLVQPVADGVYVGTASALYFLSGTEFDKLIQIKVLDGAVTLGSGVTVDGELIQRGDGVGSGIAMICIAAGYLVAGFSGGDIVKITEGRYKTTATSVAATFRVIDGIPQYLAIVQ